MRNELNKVPVITIDGPSGTGKGTISKLLAQRLHWHYLDSGLIYRGLALSANKRGVDASELKKLLELAKNLDLRSDFSAAGEEYVFLDNNVVTTEIRSETCGELASKISPVVEIREVLLARQREYARAPGLVTDGRDMGTVVFPDADLKIYLHASPEERAKRRYYQLKVHQNDVSLAQIVEELAKRDARDTNRMHSPLKPASDSIIIDTTDLNIIQVFNNVLELVVQRFDLGS